MLEAGDDNNRCAAFAADNAPCPRPGYLEGNSALSRTKPVACIAAPSHLAESHLS